MATLLAAAPRHLRVASATDSGDAVTRSHLADGRCVGWYAPSIPGWRVAIDAEYAAAEVPPMLAHRFGTSNFWARWTRTECVAKLADVPMVALWRRYGLSVPAGTVWLWRTLVLDLDLDLDLDPSGLAREVGSADREALSDLVVTVAFAVIPGLPSPGPDLPPPDLDLPPPGRSLSS
ncbi:hypothetical protein [Verrucosispora sp. NA02020]|uniref:hypothetical protein n=1 Tax=Verrucosispora sp. NA02020 TaxID=2742132 RepID=UPI003D745352